MNIRPNLGSKDARGIVPSTGIILVLLLGLSILLSTIILVESNAQKPQEVNLTGLFVEPDDRWKSLVHSAMNELRLRHPNLDIQINYTVYPYNDARVQMLNSLANKNSIDIISLDQIWLGEFANKSYVIDLTDRANNWGGLSDWYQANLDGNLYNGRVYGIWAWTDIRSIWYWKDLLHQAGVNPESLKTWDSYVQSAKKLDTRLGELNKSGIELVGGPGSQNEWYPFLWMLGGEILQYKSGHPIKAAYWFPAYNSSEGVKALGFFKALIDAKVKPITIDFEKEFSRKKYAEMLGGSWLPGYFSNLSKNEFEEKIGMIPMFPVPTEGTQNASIMGGWLLSIPDTSRHKELAWDLITIMLKPDILSPVLAKYGYLPTQMSIGEGSYSDDLRRSIPYYDELIKLIPDGRGRPNIPEYPQIADHLQEAITAVYENKKTPEQALDDAASKSAKLLGW